MSFPDFLGYVGNVGFLLGAVLLAQKKVSGFYWQIEANFMYVIVAWMSGISSLFICSIILIFINVGGIINWMRLKKNER